jgi:signal transduction histidine kinase/CheY-like chemotaxis protein
VRFAASVRRSPSAWLAAWRDLPLRRRLSALIAATAGLTALLCLLAVSALGLWLQQGQARDESREIARTLAFSLQAPMAFGDRRGVDEVLALLRARPQVTGAWVWGTDGRLLAAYGQGTPRRAGVPVEFAAYDRLVATEPVRNETETIGEVVVTTELSRLREALVLAGASIATASLAALLLSVLLAQRIAAAITLPIEKLAETTREIARSHDYSQRLPDAGGDEIGKRGQTLLESNRNLEERVTERTLSLQRERDRAEAASLAKTRFLANMSHELRTPLNAVIGAAQLLEDGRNDAQGQARLVEAIRGSGQNLLGLIDGVLDLARIESGALELQVHDFDLIGCVESALSTAAVGARMKGLNIACLIDPRVAAWRRGDAARLRQVLLNLLGNAVKFTLQGEVVLSVAPSDRGDGLTIGVADTGIGIGEASLTKIFEPFRQADDASSRRFGGSGLGLSIARQLVELMGGRLRVSSELGQGTRFDVDLTLPAAAHAAAPPPPMGHDVLFFEPHEASAQALTAHLQSLGCRPRHCRTPRELRLWLGRVEGAQVQPWVLVAADADETWGFLEESIALVDPARVVGMAALDSSDTQALRRRFRVPLGLSKPVTRQALAACLAHHVEHAREPAASEPSVEAAATLALGKHVLVVEDDPTNQLIVCSMLDNLGYRSTVADCGARAMELLGQTAYDAVLMDCQMPGMDGLEVTRRLRAGVAGRFAEVVPIIALTANAFSEDRAACLAAGMNDFLTKPVLVNDIARALRRWTQRPGGDDQAVRASAFAPLG